MTVISSVSEALISSGTGNVNALSNSQSEELKVTESFMNLMSGFGKKSNTFIDVTSDAKNIKDDTNAYESTKTFTSVNNSKIAKTNDGQIYKVTEKDVNAIEKFEDEVKTLIEEKLGITEDELVLAMQNLGLGVTDLMEPSNLMNLLLEVTASESVESLLTVGGIGEVMKGVNELTSNLANELMLEPEQLMSVVESVNQMDSKEIDNLIDISATIKSDENLANEVTDESAGNTEMFVNDGNNSVNGSQIIDQTDVSEKNVVLTETENQVAVGTQTVEAKNVNQSEASKEADDDIDETVDEMGNKVVADTEKQNQDITKKLNANSNSQDSAKDRDSENNRNPVRHDISVEVKSDGSVETTVRTENVRFDGYVDTEDIISQIMTQARVMNTQTVSSIEMQLNPESLGKILLQVTEKEGQIKAQIFTQNENVKQALESQMADFKVNMNQLGIKVDAVEVTVSSHAFEENLEGEFNQNSQENQPETSTSERRNLNLSMLDEEDINLTDEERLAANIMRDNGNQMDVIA